VCSHRIALSAEAELRGSDPQSIMTSVLDEVEVPRRRET
jgi:hypothetical protein